MKADIKVKTCNGEGLEKGQQVKGMRLEVKTAERCGWQ